MVVSCCVPGCHKNNYGDKNIRLFRFPAINKRLYPKDQEILQKRRIAWITVMKDYNISVENAHWKRICGSHFISGEPANFRDIEHPDWIPNVNLGYSTLTRASALLRLTRFSRAKKRSDGKAALKSATNRRRSANSSSTNISAQTESDAPLQQQTEVESGIDIQTDDKTASYIISLEEELKNRNEEIYTLRQVVNELTLNEAFFEGDDKKIKYFTGLPNLAVFKLILSRIETELCSLQVKKLSTFQKLLLTFMKLRHNTPFLGLGYRFRIACNQASYVFKYVVIILEKTFRYTMHWPDDSLENLTPQCFFEKFGNKVAVIVDSFEITIQRPSSFSKYKNNYTAKFIMGVTPHGYISFISTGWGGKVSDKVITEQSSFLGNLSPGDVVLADRGLTINEVVRLKYAELNLPEFARELPLLDPQDIEGTRRIASVRIHVERVIATIRNKFKILKGPIPINLLKIVHEDQDFLDYVVRLCCIFVNMCEPVAPSFDYTSEPSFEEENDENDVTPSESTV